MVNYTINRVENINPVESYYISLPLACLLNLDVNMKHHWVKIGVEMINYIRRHNLSISRTIHPNLELCNTLSVIEPFTFSNLQFYLKDHLRI